MKNKNYLYGLLATVVFFLAACTSTYNDENIVNTAKSSVIESAGPKHTLWKVTGEKNEVYLLGTIHILKESDYPLADVFDMAFEDAENIVFEISQNELDEATVQKLVQEIGMYTDGSTLANHISSENYQTISEAATANGLPMPMLDVMEPWLSSTALTVMLAEQLGYKGEFGVDKHFEGRATAEGKNILTFEKTEQQLRMLDSISMGAQTEMLLDFVLNIKEQPAELDKMHQAWLDADAEFLGEYLIEEIKQFDGVYDILLKNRNDAWMNDIKPMLKAHDDYMITVGAAHMYGEDGLIKQISDLGYKIEQL